MAGLAPANQGEVNIYVGGLLRDFSNLRDRTSRYQADLAGRTLQTQYGFTATEEADIKTALNGLNTALQAVDMTFIRRLTGLF